MATEKRTPLFLLKTKSLPVDGYEEFFNTFEDGRFNPIFVPVLEHHFNAESLEKVTRLAKSHAFNLEIDADGEKYGGFIFTSQRAVEAFASIVHSLRSQGAPVDQIFPATLPLYAVGPATAKSLRTLKLHCSIIGEESGNGEALAKFILPHYNEHIRNISSPSASPKPGLLFLVGEQRRDIIPRSLQSLELPPSDRIAVEELVVYETGEMQSFRNNFAALAGPGIEAGRYQWAVVFSPTGGRAMLEVLDLLDEVTGKAKAEAKNASIRKTRVATIGPTTRDYLKREFDFEPDVCATKPSAEGIASGILDMMNGK